MKRLILMLLCFSICLCGCGEAQTVKEDKISVITTVFPSFDFVRRIGGDRVSVRMLLSPGADAHSFEPSPKDVVDISESDLFIYVGGENDTWIDGMLGSLNDVNTLKIVDCVDLIDEEIKEGMSGFSEHLHEHEETEADDHVWTSPKNAAKIVERIKSELCVIDPENSDYYTKNAEEYKAELEALDEDFREIIKNSKRNTLVFGDRFPARYFVEEYGLNYFAAFPGCSSSVEANPKSVEFLIDKIKNEKIPAVLYIELSDKRMARVLSEETGAKLLLFHSAHNISEKDFNNGVTYLEIMKNNEKTLKEALS